jgi:Tol biopolymer transport system component
LLTAALPVLGVLLAASLALGQAPPSTDIWIVPIDLTTTPASLGEARNLTDRDGYDNQPFFEPEGGGLLFTRQVDEQTEIFRARTDTWVVAALTDTPESEYSPTVVPGGLEISLIRVESDGTQRLWAVRRDGSAPRVVLEHLAPVGYHAWTPGGALVTFVLGEPATLQLADLAAGTGVTVAADIGRSLHPLPDGSGFSFLQRLEGAWRIRSLDLESGDLGELGAPFEESQDMAWTPDGRILMGSGSRIAGRSVDGAWEVLGDLAASGVHGITRLAVHPEGTWLAITAER